jgi:hypothetical protein
MEDQAVELHIQTQVVTEQQGKVLMVVVLLTVVVVILVAEAVAEQQKLVFLVHFLHPHKEVMMVVMA